MYDRTQRGDDRSIEAENDTENGGSGDDDGRAGMTANAIVRLVGQIVGDYGPEGAQDRWHFPSFRKGCYYGRTRDCCPVCQWRIARYEAQFDPEAVSIDVTHARARSDGGEQRDRDKDHDGEGEQ